MLWLASLKNIVHRRRTLRTSDKSWWKEFSSCLARPPEYSHWSNWPSQVLMGRRRQEPHLQPRPRYWYLNILPRGLNKVLHVVLEIRKDSATTISKDWSLWVKEILCEPENQDTGYGHLLICCKVRGNSFRRNRLDLIKMANSVSEQPKDSEVRCSSQVHHSTI